MARVRTAEIVAVGSELLTPFRLDTNSLVITERLNELGVALTGKSVVGDDRSRLATRLREALARADLVVATGGLGPTADDVTRDAAAEVVGRELVEDPAVLSTIRERFARRGVRMPEINRRQAQVIAGAALLPNPYGTAPGQLLEIEGRLLVLLPGPTREMQAIFDESVRPRLERSGAPGVERRVVKVTGRSESQVEEIAHPIYARWLDAEPVIETTILASPGVIELHLSTLAEDAALGREALERAARELEAALAPAAFSIDGRPLERVVGKLLHDRGWTIAVAESCTAGLLLARLTEVPGSSAWVLGGVVAYADDVKTRHLGVPASLIASEGAVSAAVAEAMADGVRERFGADVGVGVTGIAGPGGGSDAKPVGTVWIAVSAANRARQRYLFPGDRQAVRQHAVAAALDLVRRQSGVWVPT
jgi:nicotinamide-nucleotide amidase